MPPSFEKWTAKQQFIFRLCFIYFLLQAVPLDPHYFRHVRQIDWATFGYHDLYYLSRYTPQFISGAYHPLTWGLNTFTDWAFIFAVATAGAVTWTLAGGKVYGYNNLYYALRVILRYRLAVAMLAYGFIKLFPLELPYPSLSLKNSLYGDLSDWKIASISYGVAPAFESFLGCVEIIGALLLFNRKTASIGAVIIIGFVWNVFLSNLGYNGGEALYSLYLVSIAAVIVFYDASRWHRLIMQEKATAPNTYRPHYRGSALKRIARTVKYAFIIAVFGLFTFNAYALYRDGGYQYPRTAGLTGATGIYNVSEFRWNNQSLPYSLTDSVRWQNVVFEQWNTISIRSLQKVIPDTANTEEIYVNDWNRNYESSGSAGRKFFSYQIDYDRRRLLLQNKNKHHSNEEWLLTFQRPTMDRIILNGTNQQGDSIAAVLDRIDKIYLLDESYRLPQKRSVFE
jgi:hypothetical protein